MKNKDGILPIEKVQVERNGDEVVITFWDGTYAQSEENGKIIYEYELYQSRHRWRDNIKDIITSSFDIWYDAAKKAEEHKLAEAEIDVCKARLNETDYKIIKSYEYALAGEPSPYDIAELHASRQALRDKIDAMQQI